MKIAYTKLQQLISACIVMCIVVLISAYAAQQIWGIGYFTLELKPYTNITLAAVISMLLYLHDIWFYIGVSIDDFGKKAIMPTVLFSIVYVICHKIKAYELIMQLLPIFYVAMIIIKNNHSEKRELAKSFLRFVIAVVISMLATKYILLPLKTKVFDIIAIDESSILNKIAYKIEIIIFTVLIAIRTQLRKRATNETEKNTTIKNCRNSTAICNKCDFPIRHEGYRKNGDDSTSEDETNVQEEIKHKGLIPLEQAFVLFFMLMCQLIQFSFIALVTTLGNVLTPFMIIVPAFLVCKKILGKSIHFGFLECSIASLIIFYFASCGVPALNISLFAPIITGAAIALGVFVAQIKSELFEKFKAFYMRFHGFELAELSIEDLTMLCKKLDYKQGKIDRVIDIFVNGLDAKQIAVKYNIEVASARSFKSNVASELNAIKKELQ